MDIGALAYIYRLYSRKPDHHVDVDGAPILQWQTKQVRDSRHSGVPTPLDNATKPKLPTSMSTMDASEEETNKVDIETGDSNMR
jgi:hypothetical protein